jgi:hypothetical protein
VNDSSQHNPYTITLGDNTATETLTITAGGSNDWINMGSQLPALTTDQIQLINLSDIKLDDTIYSTAIGGAYIVPDGATTLTGPTPTYSYNLNDLNNITIQPLDTSQWANLTTAQIGALNTLNTDYITSWNQQQEFVDTWPAWYRMKDMAAKYPAIKKALENLSTVYTMVKDDYDNPTPKR